MFISKEVSVMSETIVFIGLGIMGRPMAHNLLKVGYSLIVFDRHPETTAELVASGASLSKHMKEIAAKSDILITMLPDSHQVEEVLTNQEGVLAGTHQGLIVIDMSTISPVVTRRIAHQLAQHGVTMLDAPVSGGDKGAIAGTLSIMIGGNEAVFLRCLPVFQTLGKTI